MSLEQIDKHCTLKPTPSQADFCKSDRFITTISGPMATGKTIALIMSALRFVDEPDYEAMIFRRRFSDLMIPGGIVDNARRIIQGAVWSDLHKRFTFSSGARLSFGYAETECDLTRYCGTEFQYIGIDRVNELHTEKDTVGTIPEAVLRLMIRLRDIRSGSVPLRLALTISEADESVEWLRCQKFRVDFAGKQHHVKTSWAENPHVNRDEVVKQLESLDPVTRDCLMGEWI
jgi:Terminase large subunit, T4likevirus-type, N-terminal